VVKSTHLGSSSRLDTIAHIFLDCAMLLVVSDVFVDCEAPVVTSSGYSEVVIGIECACVCS